MYINNGNEQNIPIINDANIVIKIGTFVSFVKPKLISHRFSRLNVTNAKKTAKTKIKIINRQGMIPSL